VGGELLGPRVIINFKHLNLHPLKPGRTDAPIKNP